MKSGRLVQLLAAFIAGGVVASAFGAYMLVAHPRFVSKVVAHLPRIDLSSGTAAAPPTPDLPLNGVVIRIDTLAPTQPISPLIYGVSFADPAYAKLLGATVNRWGGNSASTFNWDNGHAWNAGRDWEFRNNNGGRSGNAVDTFIAQSLGVGMQPLVTIPTIGWVAKNDDSNTMARGVPSSRGTPSSPGYHALYVYDPALNPSPPTRP